MSLFIFFRRQSDRYLIVARAIKRVTNERRHLKSVRYRRTYVLDKTKKIASNNFTEKNREKSNIAIKIFEK